MVVGSTSRGLRCVKKRRRLHSTAGMQTSASISSNGIRVLVGYGIAVPQVHILYLPG